MNDTSLSSPRRRLRASLAFALCNLPLVWLIALRYVPYLETPDDWLGASYLVTTWVGHFGLLVLLAWVPLAVIALDLPRRAAWLPAALLATAGLWLLLLDTGVYAQYRFHINQFMITLFLNDQNGEIFSFTTTTWLAVLGIALVLLAGEAWLARFLFNSSRTVRLPVWHMAGALLLIMTASHAIHIVGDARYQRSVTQQAAIYPLLFPATAKDFMEARGWLDPRAARNANIGTSPEGAESLNWPRQPLSCNAGTRPPNILLVLIDSWRRDEYSARNTPRMHAALDGTGRRYLSHFSGGNSTRSGVMSLFYGLTGNYYHLLEDTQTPSLLIKQLQETGYELGIFSAASLDSVGFDRSVFASVPELPPAAQGETPAQRDRAMTESWLDWQATRRRTDSETPWFGMLFYDAPHGYSTPQDATMPFQPTARRMNYLKLGPDTDPRPYYNLHRNAVYHDDRLIGRVIDDLKASGDWQNTVLIVTGDHGQSFNDFGKNYWGHNSHFAPPQTQVPMILHGPGISAGKHEGTTSHLDVVPTLMRHVLGCANASQDYSQGRDMLDATLDHPWVMSSSYLDYGIIEKQRITVVDGTGSWKVVDRQLNEQKETISPAVLEAMQVSKRFYAP
ncbi:DUF3413 domain-containing protein [Modicisalibacter xianhensis]|uniref:Uncharacterized protein n=1 Tax=Modicisalibacter xianhensis TaxID=442341 RepID=A0A1I3B9D6_9GAMM|nr:DUF3413 domain-containing protein [Halomonas xianhensis]SFH58884.1 hypothetical protein SAMN04487959_10668 [Halomonas xianhensis]